MVWWLCWCRYPVPGVCTGPSAGPGPGATPRCWSGVGGHQRSSLFSCHSQLTFHPLWSRHTAANWCRFIQSENIEIISYDRVLRIFLNYRLNSADLRKGLTQQILSTDFIYSVLLFFISCSLSKKEIRSQWLLSAPGCSSISSPVIVSARCHFFRLGWAGLGWGSGNGHLLKRRCSINFRRR